MPDAVLINPASDAIYQNLSDGLTAIEPPAWCRMIAGWLIEREYTVAIIDQPAEGIPDDAVLDRIRAYSPGIVAIVAEGHQPSASTQTMTGAGRLARAIRDVPTIMVGNHPSALPELTLAEEDVDFVCDGEGPITIAGLIDGLPLEDIPGLVWGRVNPRAPLIPIDELHGDVWGLLPMERYRAHNWQCLDGSPRRPYASIHTTLGCPFKCSFCMINTFQHANRYRMRSPDSVVNEIEVLYRWYGVRTFKIADEMFVLNDRHVEAICKPLAAKPFSADLNIWAYARIDTVKPAHLEMLRSAGIRWLALGIESGSAHVRDGAGKTLDEADIENTVRAIQRAGINVIGNYMFGLPDDTLDTMRATLDLAKRLNCEFANFYSAMAYPGSRLYRTAQPWSSYSQHSVDCMPMGNAHLAPAEIVAFRDMAFQEYFGGHDYREMIMAKFGAAALEEIDGMRSMPLPRAAA